MIYVDTSAIIKLYFREQHSQETSTWLKKANQQIPLTALHDLEFINAIDLKQFRNEISKAEVASVLKRVNEHEAKGIFYRPKTDWVGIFSIAIDLSKEHTGKIGSRSLEISSMLPAPYRLARKSC